MVDWVAPGINTRDVGDSYNHLPTWLGDAVNFFHNGNDISKMVDRLEDMHLIKRIVQERKMSRPTVHIHIATYVRVRLSPDIDAHRILNFFPPTANIQNSSHS